MVVLLEFEAVLVVHMYSGLLLVFVDHIVVLLEQLEVVALVGRSCFGLQMELELVGRIVAVVVAQF